MGTFLLQGHIFYDKDYVSQKMINFKGTISTCPEAQIAKEEGLLLVKQWLKQKKINSPLEWAKCASAE